MLHLPCTTRIDAALFLVCPYSGSIPLTKRMNARMGSDRTIINFIVFIIFIFNFWSCFLFLFIRYSMAPPNFASCSAPMSFSAGVASCSSSGLVWPLANLLLHLLLAGAASCSSSEGAVWPFWHLCTVIKFWVGFFFFSAGPASYSLKKVHCAILTFVCYELLLSLFSGGAASCSSSEGTV